jgi:cytochrome-b5 reductase
MSLSPGSAGGAAAGQGSAPMYGTTRVRQKVVLKPGHSLRDWVALSSTRNLSGTSAPRPVPVSELAKHASREDAWMSIRGKVYNVTSYMDYHPGGVEFLMRGAGIDATDLFDEYHKWVNLDNMLKGCFVGHLVPGS